MPSTKRSTDPDYFPFEYTAGVTIPVWKGLDLRGSNAYPAEDTLRQGQNIRPSGDGYQERAGQAKFTVIAVESIEGLHESTDIGAALDLDFDTPGVGFGFAAGGYQGHEVGVWPANVTLDDIDSREFRSYSLDINSDDATWFKRVMPTRYVGRIYMDGNGDVSQPNIMTYKGLNTELQIAISPEADEFCVYGSCVDGGNIFHFLARTDAGTTRVYTWNGTVKTLVATLSDAAVESLYAVGFEIYAYGTGKIHRRTSGGAWSSTIVIPTNIVFNAIPQLYATKIWFAGQDNTTPLNPSGVVYSYSGAGTTLTLERTFLDTPDGTGSRADVAFVFNTCLYVGWFSQNDILANIDVFIAQFDGAVWLDENTVFSQGTKDGRMRMLFSDGSDLYICITSFGEGVTHDFYHSAGLDVTTVWSAFKTLGQDTSEENRSNQQVPVVLLTGATI